MVHKIAQTILCLQNYLTVQLHRTIKHNICASIQKMSIGNIYKPSNNHQTIKRKLNKQKALGDKDPLIDSRQIQYYQKIKFYIINEIL
jgi:hypothetical protein